MGAPAIIIEVIPDGSEYTGSAAQPRPPSGRRHLAPIASVAVVGVLFYAASLFADSQSSRTQDAAPAPAATAVPPESVTSRASERLNAVRVAESVPRSLLAAELYAANPSPAAVRDLLQSIGGLQGATVGTAEGAFDLVTFDPLNSDRLLATDRRSYGTAENQHVNQLWLVGDGSVEQRLWAPTVNHDFAHFNVDGTITMWVRNHDDAGFAPRTAVLMNGDGSPIASSSSSMYASRFAASNGKVFALTGDGNYSSQARTYEDLVADDGTTRTVLADGAAFAWIDNPVAGLLLAYPAGEDGVTAVWDTSTLERLDNHPLAGRRYRRVAVSGDQRTAVGNTFDGALEQVDLATGTLIRRFGSLDAAGIDRPIALNQDGTIAVTVDRLGRVTVWQVGDDAPIATIAAEVGQPRWVSDRRAALLSSTVAADASRIAVRVGARPHVSVHWMLIDTSVEAWIQRACELAGRRMEPRERAAIGLPAGPGACQ